MVVVGFLFVIISSSTVSANAPASVSVSYEIIVSKLDVNITHPVDDPTVHYINMVVIRKNGELYNRSMYSSQPFLTTFTYTYKVIAQKNDTIDVTVSCNQGGSKSVHYIVSYGTTNPPEPSSTSTPGFELVVLVAAMSLVFYLYRKTKD